MTIVTESTYGIGEAIARVLAGEGAVYIVTGRSQEEGKKVVEAITNEEGKSGMSCKEMKKQLNSKHPIGHIGELDDTAYSVLYLVSDEATFVTGSELIIDGGYTAT